MKSLQAQLLDKNYKRASLEKVRSGKVELGGKVQTINASERDFVAKLSKRLDLDAVEALKIFRNFMKYEATGRFEYDAETSLREVMRHYYRERQALLKCLSAIFRISMADQDNAPVEEAQQRLSDPKNKLDRRMLEQFINLSDEPEARQDQEAWAKNNLEEQSLCLEVLFLYFYCREPVFEPETILSYARYLKKHIAWDKIHPLLGEESRPLMNRICVQCVLILLALFGLETIVEDGDQTPGRATKHCLPTTRQLFGKEFEQWARDLNVVPFLSVMTHVFARNDPHVAGYKSVICGEISAALTCFDIGAVGEFDHLLQLYHDIFFNETAITLPYLKANFTKKCNALYHISRSSFPHEFDPFVRLSQTFAADSICAEFMFRQILELKHFTVSRGLVHRVDSDEFIQWNIGNYSGWTYFMGKIYVLATKLSNRQPTSASEIVQVTLILRLMNQLFAKKDDLIKYLNDHLKGTMGRNTNLLRQLFTLLRTSSNLASSSPALLEMLDACVRCINHFATSHPLQVWEEMRRGGVLQEMSSSIKGKPDGDIRQILMLEQRNGLYPITISFLNLLYTLLSYARKWQLPETQTNTMQDEGDMDSVSLEDFHPCLSFVKADLFARYESWRYQKPQQKHKIGIKIMNIFIDILSEDTVKNLTGQTLPMAKTDMDLSLASPMAKYQPMTPLGTFNNPFL
ncbi:nucleoporin, putative, partial [Acanthamoeba castellanii str. Neff]